jgi:autotransporter passenger strand-loop-strand repeat protein
MAKNYVVNSGVTSSLLALRNGDTLRMLSGGSIHDITASSGGVAYLSGGVGLANSICSSGLINTYKDVAVTATYVSAGGSFYLYGGSAKNTFLYSGGTMSVLGATANIIKVGDRAHLEMVAGTVLYASLGGTGKYRANFTVYGGSAGYTELRGGGAMILSGGTGNNTSVLSGGTFGVVGGTALNTSVDSGGVMSVVGATASWGVVYGSVMVLNGGVMKNMTVNEGGTVLVAVNGSASGGAVYESGTINVRGGRAENIKIWAGGTMNVQSNASWDEGRAVGITLTAGSDAVLNVSRGGILEDSVLSYGTLNVRGKMLNCSVCGEESFTVLGGGSASGTTIAGSGVLTVSAGGTVLDTTMFLFGTHTDPRGQLVILSQGLASGVFARYGHSVCVSGGTVSSAVIEGNAALRVVSGGTAVDAKIYGNATIGLDSLLSSGYIYSRTADCLVSGSAKDVTVTGSGRIVLWGRAENVSVGYAGNMYINRGGLATDVSVEGFFDSGVTVFSGGSLCRVKVCAGGNVDILSGGFVSSATLSSGADGVYVFSGGLLSAATCESGAKLIVSGSGSASGLTVSKGALLSFCVAKETFISGTSAGSAFEIKNGAVNGFSVDSGCQLVVSSGCLAQAIRENGGYVDVIPGANVSFSPNSFSKVELSYNCNATVHSGTTATGVIVHKNGRLVIGSGGSALGIVEDGGYVEVAPGAQVSFAVNSFSDMDLVNSNCTVHSGTTATNIEVATEKTMYVFSGGIARNLQVTNGTLVVSAGGMICGLTVNKNKGNVFAYDAIVNFDVSTDTPSETSFVNDLKLIQGTADYRITVSASNTKAGDYVLANGAAGFDRTVTVKSDTGSTLGTLKNGGTLKSGDRTYSLNVDADALTLTVTGGVVPATAVTVAGSFAGAGGVFQLMSDGSGVVRTANAATTLTGTLDPSKWELAAVGDFGGLGKDGLLWLEKSTGYAYMQFDMTTFAEVTNKSYCLGVVGDGYTIKAGGDFSGSEIDGVLMQGPAFGDPSISLNYGLPVWARDNTGATFNGWLGALVNTWEPGDPLKGDLSDPASINANNYKYDIVGVGDFNGDGRDDVMLQNTMPKVVNQGGVDYAITGSGDVFTFLTGNEEAIKAGAPPTVCYAGCATDGWSVLGFGDFDNDGATDALLSDGTGLAGWKMGGGQRFGDFWFGNLASGQSIVGVADVDNDGTDDLIVAGADDSMTAWLVKNGNVTGSMMLA